jgi:hypothetical protein
MSEVEHIMYYRGQRCPLTNQLCQEGFCRGCEIYKNKTELIRIHRKENK